MPTLNLLDITIQRFKLLYKKIGRSVCRLLFVVVVVIAIVMTSAVAVAIVMTMTIFISAVAVLEADPALILVTRL